MFGFKKKKTNPFGDDTTKEVNMQEKNKDEWVWVEGYKATESDMKCKGFQYELCVLYSMPEDEVETCRRGYHLCLNLEHVLEYYDVTNGHRFFKVQACVRKKDLDKYGKEIDWDTVIDKLVAKDIKFIEEVSVDEIWDVYMDANNISQEVRNVLMPYKEHIQSLGFGGINDLYHQSVLIEDGYSKSFAWYLAKYNKFEIAHAVASQKDLSMDVKALYILED